MELSKKEKLINDVSKMLMQNMFEYESFIEDLVKEALNKRTQKELKELL